MSTGKKTSSPRRLPRQVTAQTKANGRDDDDEKQSMKQAREEQEAEEEEESLRKARKATRRSSAKRAGRGGKGVGREQDKGRKALSPPATSSSHRVLNEKSYNETERQKPGKSLTGFCKRYCITGKKCMNRRRKHGKAVDDEYDDAGFVEVEVVVVDDVDSDGVEGEDDEDTDEEDEEEDEEEEEEEEEEDEADEVDD
ncbi:hypothetical protein DFH27DRAFT_604570 [Peziza echinospora]|nr:hypothetical protein DFH27DRAFT_604570 [Peziza echinospora]